MDEIDSELKEIVRSCLEENREARRRFQDLFGQLIYDYPVKKFHLPEDNSGDFYIYVFENDRVFRRLEGFEGRNDAHFKTYLSFYVLRDLFFEWQRSQKELDTVSLEAPVSVNDETTLYDILADPRGTVDEILADRNETGVVKDIFESLDPEKRLILKLVHLAECDLTPEEIRLLRKKGGRSYREVIAIVEATRSRLKAKDEQFTSMQDQVESVFGRIALYQKELAEISENLKGVEEGSTAQVVLTRKKEELERKLKWRYRQGNQMRAKAQQFHITTPYKDIAVILNVPVGTVCSLVARIRKEL